MHELLHTDYELLYIHCGGNEGNASQIDRHKHKREAQAGHKHEM
jgi:hypothetical protein